MTTRATGGPDSFGSAWNAARLVWSRKSGRTSDLRSTTTPIAPELRKDAINSGSIIAAGRSTQAAPA